MKKLTVILLLLIPILSFTQKNENEAEIQLAIIKKQLKFGNAEKIDSIILIEAYKAKQPPDFTFLDELMKDSVESSTFSQLYTQTYKNETFINRVIEEPAIKKSLRAFKQNFHNHPKITIASLEDHNLHFQSITSEQYHKFFGRKSRKVDKAWKKINRKFRTIQVIAFSKIEFYKDFATIYYEHHCGGLCGSGNIVMLEKVNEQWVIIAEINLWMS